MLHLPRGLRGHGRWAGTGWLLALAGCGGGFYLGDGIDQDDPPVVELVVSPNPATPGATLRLQAAATDDSGIARVGFFSIDGAVSTLLGAEDTSAPYALDVTLSASDTGTLQFFARATDDEGQSRDSAAVSVSVNP